MWTELVKQLEDLKAPVRIHEPRCPHKPTPEQARDYANLREQYEIDLDHYKRQKWAYNLKRAELENKIAETMLDSVSIPTQYRNKCWALAWEYGHSSGYQEVHNFLLDLETIFE